MKTVSVPTRRHHFATAKAMNSGPWSERTYLGAPRSRARRSRHLTTPSPSMEPRRRWRGTHGCTRRSRSRASGSSRQRSSRTGSRAPRRHSGRSGTLQPGEAASRLAARPADPPPGHRFAGGVTTRRDVLGGIIHEYERAACLPQSAQIRQESLRRCSHSIGPWHQTLGSSMLEG